MSSKVAPGPSFLKLLTYYPAIRKDLVAPLQQFFDLYGDSFRLPMGRTSVYAFRTPEAAKDIFQEKAKSFARSYESLVPMLGDGVFTSEGEKWRKQRKMLAPIFHHKSIQNFYAVILEETKLLSQDWQALPDSKIIVDSWLMKSTLSIITRTMISTEFSEPSSDLNKHVSDAMEIVLKRARALVNIPLYIPTRRHLKLRRAIKGVDRILLSVIQNRRKETLDGKDMLDLLMGMQEEDTGETFSNPEIRDNLCTMILAGHESTATSISWALYLLAKHPEIQEKLYQEIISAVPMDQDPQMMDFYEMKFLNQVFKEVLRLYPPFWYLERKTIEEVVIDGTLVPKNQRIGISPYFVHRNPEVWENPDEFKPERFEEDQIANRHKMAWIPFGGGPRYCLGQPFATLETLCILFELVRKFRFELVPEHSIEFNASVTLRAKHGIMLKKQLRSAAPAHLP